MAERNPEVFQEIVEAVVSIRPELQKFYSEVKGKLKYDADWVLIALIDADPEFMLKNMPKSIFQEGAFKLRNDRRIGPETRDIIDMIITLHDELFPDDN